MTPNRTVALVVAGLGLLAAVLPAIADMDWTSTAGVIGGLGGVVAIAYKWLDGWQKAEARSADPMLGTVEGDPPAVADPIA